jgi:hypothetical protein
MINECRCGEILMDDAATCPACGAVNERYTPPSGFNVPLLFGAGVLGALGNRLGLPWYVPLLVVCVGIVALRLARPEKEP